MTKKIALSACAAYATLMLTGCGGSSSATSGVTGTFVDATVVNLPYECDPSGKTGNTDAKGQFVCSEGDKVFFKVGSMSIGPVEAVEGMTVTPYNLYPMNDEAAINLAQLLISLDTDNSSETITVNPAQLESLLTGDLDLTSETFDNDAQLLLNDANLILVSEDTAKDHLADSDTVSPVVTVLGLGTVTITVGDEYMDTGATAYDVFDGAMDPVRSGTVNTSVAGTYTYTYTATDHAGNVGKATRTIIVEEAPTVDTQAPVVTLNGEATVTITIGDSYADAGATAEDNVDGAITPVMSGTVNTTVAGTYTITWTATDDAGNIGTATRTIIVQEAGEPTPTTQEELEASNIGDACIDANGDEGVVDKDLDPFGNPIPGTATCEANTTEEPTPTTQEALEASNIGDACIDANGDEGVVDKDLDPFGNPIPGTATCEASTTQEPTPTTQEALEASEIGDTCVDSSGETGVVAKDSDPFGNPIPGTATCTTAV